MSTSDTNEAPAAWKEVTATTSGFENLSIRNEVFPLGDAEIEKQLFAPRGKGAGENLVALELEIKCEGPDRKPAIQDFAHSGLNPLILDNMAKSGFQRPTAIQGFCIPNILAGKDIVAVAQTGSGKTAAYLAPSISTLIDKVAKISGPRIDTTIAGYDPDKHKVRAEPLILVVCPTRELALQIFHEARRLSYRSSFRLATAYGGIPLKMNLQQLGKGCDILIGTPGRLADLLDRPEILSMQRVKYTIIDEADEMLTSQSYVDALSKILEGGDSNEDADHHYLMFSATFPKEARSLARQYLQQDHVVARVGRAGSTHKNVTQKFIQTGRHEKDQVILKILEDMEPKSTLIFCNNTPGVARVDDLLFKAGYPTMFLHGQRPQHEREDILRNFHLKKHLILITTSLTARGIDFADVATVINFDLPSTEFGGIQEYVHRIGRTGRIGHKGNAISIYNPDTDESIAQDLVNLLIEADQDVPEFLSHLKPDDGNLQFNDDTDEEDENGDQGIGGWGSKPADTTEGNDGWGSGSAEKVGTGAEKTDETNNESWGSGAGKDTSNAGW